MSGWTHEIYIVASVRTKCGRRKYRCLAHFHCRYLYKRQPAHALNRILAALSDPFNASVVQSEMESMANYTDELFTNGAGGDSGYCDIYGDLRGGSQWQACPFTVALVLSACIVVLETGDHHDEVRLEDLTKDFICCSSDQGFTVIDISDLLEPRYCHGNFDLRDHKNIWGAPANAEQYLRCYYDDLAVDAKEGAPSIASLLDVLNKVPLVTPEALHATWPDEFPLPEGSPRRAETVAIPDHPVQHRQLAGETLAKAALSRLFGSIVAPDGTAEAVDALPNTAFLAHYLDVIHSCLHASPALSPGALALLKRLICAKESPTVDLTRWSSSLTGDALRYLTPALISSKTKTLNVSNCPGISAPDILELVQTFPAIERIIAINCVAIDASPDALQTLPISAMIRTSAFRQPHPRRAGQQPEGRFVHATDDCFRARKSDPPAQLTIFAASSALDRVLYGRLPDSVDVRAYVAGCEINQFHATGLVWGLTWLIKTTFLCPWDGYMRDKTKTLCLILSALDRPTSSRYRQLGMARGVPPKRVAGLPKRPHPNSLAEPYPLVPRQAGWTFVLDTNPKTKCSVSKPFYRPEQAEEDDTRYTPRYAFVRFEKVVKEDGMVDGEDEHEDGVGDVEDEDEDWQPKRRKFWRPDPKDLVAVEVLSLTEWLAQLPPGHGVCSEDVLEEFEMVVSKTLDLEWPIDEMSIKWSRDVYGNFCMP